MRRKSSRFQWMAAAVAALQALMICQANAQSLAVNFIGRSGTDAVLDSAAVAGVVPQDHWRNVATEDSSGFDGTASFLQDSDGTATSVSLEWIGNDAWNLDVGTPASPDEQLMEGILKCNPDDGVFTPHANSAMTFRFHNLLAGSTYNVIVYQAHNGAGAKSITTAGGTSYYTEEVTTWGGSWVRSTGASTNDFQLANYVQIDNVSPDSSGTIEIISEKFLEDPQVTDGMGVPGVQLVKVTGDWPLVTDPPTITADPQDFLGTVGDRVSLSVATDGPWTIEWFKNGGSEQVDTDTTYEFISTAGDKDAEVYAVVSNPVGSSTSAVAIVTLDDPLPYQLIPGFLRGEHYGNNTGIGNVYPDVYNNADFQARNYDNEFFTLGGYAPDAGEDNFFRIMEGYVVPQVSGDYRFFISSDDQCELFINPTGGTAESLPDIPSNFSGLTPDASEDSWTNVSDYEDPGANETTEIFTLEAGKYYGVASIYRDGTGGDHWQLAWRQEGDTTPVDDLPNLGPLEVYCNAIPSGKRATLTEQPQSTTKEQGRTATFTVAAETLPRANEFAVQWTWNGVAIPGAVNNSYETDLLNLSDDGAVVQARVFTVVGEVLSDPATLNVTADTTPPEIVSAGSFAGATTIGMVFDERMDETSLADMANYAVDGVTVTGLEVLGADGDAVALTVDAAPAAGASVTVSGLTDWSGNPPSVTSQAIEISDLEATVLVRTEGSDPGNEGRSIPLGDGNLYMEAGGSDIWDSQDSGHSALKSFTGPFTMRVRVESLTGPNEWTKAVITAREDATGGARNLAVVATRTRGVNNLGLQWRNAANAGSASSVDVGVERISPVPYPNAWIRLDRPDASSNLFESYVSSDGENWTLQHAYTMPDPVLPETLLVGMAATGHDNTSGVAPARALFREFSIEPLEIVAHPTVDTVGIVDGSFTVLWSNGGEVETAPAVDGPWTPTGDTDGVYSEPVGSDSEKYFRAN